MACRIGAWFAISAIVAACGKESRTLTVDKRLLAGATGSVSADGIDCGARCASSYASSASVVLASADATFQSYAVDCPGAACIRTTAPSITLSMTTDHAVAATFRPGINYAFVTSTLQGANLGGLSGADAICAARAEAAALGGHNYVAWLSTASTEASLRFAPARGWMRTDGAPFILDAPHSASLYPPRLDEFGDDLGVSSPTDDGFTPVWTGTDVTNGSFNCRDWTSTAAGDSAVVGNASAGELLWSSSGLYGCEGWSLRLLCFETDYVAPLSPPAPPPGARLAFVSRPFTPVQGGSIADADAQCMSEAAAAGLAGTFKSLVADVGKAPLDPARFDTAKGTWYRLDGVPIVTAASDLAKAGGPLLAVPIDLEANGQTRVFDEKAWTGFGGATDDYSVPGTAQTTCNGWSSIAASDLGVDSLIGFTWDSYRRVPGWQLPACNSARRLYCLQQ